MHTDLLDKHIKGYYDDQMLSSEKLASLITASKTNQVSGDQCSNGQLAYWMGRWRFQRNLSIAAGLLLVVVGVFQLQSFISPDVVSLPLKVAQEIALNHNKQLVNEFEVNTFVELGTMMTKLDFAPIAARRMKDSGFRIIGGRYCSIQGHLAAQVQFVDDQGKGATLYQTQLSGALAELTESEHVVDGVKVQLWQENGLIFGLAESN
ncbi:hypothetical protein MNBD_GAMMA26-1749 [hydrothermal vent metagenome]|uniref:DUF3379 domain-containing protein n=1 Tax=hydrothermal vent metagenome TaxID=652676 RepID=A0A3B1AWJ2_9ZZZZ